MYVCEEDIENSRNNVPCTARAQKVLYVIVNFIIIIPRHSI